MAQSAKVSSGRAPASREVRQVTKLYLTRSEERALQSHMPPGSHFSRWIREELLVPVGRVAPRTSLASAAKLHLARHTAQLIQLLEALRGDCLRLPASLDIVEILLRLDGIEERQREMAMAMRKKGPDDEP